MRRKTVAAPLPAEKSIAGGSPKAYGPWQGSFAWNIDTGGSLRSPPATILPPLRCAKELTFTEKSAAPFHACAHITGHICTESDSGSSQFNQEQIPQGRNMIARDERSESRVESGRAY